MNRVVAAAYLGAIEIDCPACAVEAGAHCFWPSIEGGRSRVRRVPCVARSAAAGRAGLCAAHTGDDEPPMGSRAERDFSEPLRADRRRDDG
jgi:hypothetical protein